VTIAEMFSSPSAAHQTVNRRQLGTALDLMQHHSQRGGDSTPSYYMASEMAAEAMEPMYQHEMKHRDRERNPFGIEAKSPEPPAPDLSPRELEDKGELVGQHSRRLQPTRGGHYVSTVVPYGTYNRSHSVYVEHPRESAPVADVKWNPHGGEIEWAHTDSDHRRQGLATQAIAHARDAASMTPRMTSPLPSPELSDKGLALSQGILSREQWG
jgi:hypothetical protein